MDTSFAVVASPKSASVSVACAGATSSVPAAPAAGAHHLPGPETTVLAVMRPAHPYKRAIQNRFAMENAKGT
jgi:hypothetical protein